MKKFFKFSIFYSICSLLSGVTYAEGPVYNFNFYNGKQPETIKANLNTNSENKPEQSSENNTDNKSTTKQNMNMESPRKRDNGFDFSFRSYRLTQESFGQEIEREMSGIGVGYKVKIFENTYLMPQVLFLKSNVGNSNDLYSDYGYVDYSGSPEEETTTNFRLTLARKFSLNDSSSVTLGLSAYKLKYEILNQYFDYYDSLTDETFEVIGGEVLVGLNWEFQKIDLYVDIGLGRGKVKDSQSYGEGLTNDYVSSLQGSVGLSFYL